MHLDQQLFSRIGQGIERGQRTYINPLGLDEASTMALQTDSYFLGMDKALKVACKLGLDRPQESTRMHELIRRPRTPKTPLFQ